MSPPRKPRGSYNMNRKKAGPARPPRVCLLLPEDAREQLKQALQLAEPAQRLAALDLATARIRKKYPHLYRQPRYIQQES